MGTQAVSYTHLDVYKRQLYAPNQTTPSAVIECKKLPSQTTPQAGQPRTYVGEIVKLP